MCKRIINLAIVGLLALCTSAGGALAQRDTRELLREEFHQTYQLAPDGRVTLNNINGPVHIQGWERNEVRLDAVKSAYKQTRLTEANIEVRAAADSIEIRTRYPHESQTFTDEAPRRYDNPASVEYTLNVPRGARLENIELINGALDLAGLSGETHASCINGKLTARALSGEAKLSTINGTLDAAFGQLDPAKSLSLNSINGTVALTLPSDANANVKASTIHGTITNDFGLPVHQGRYVGTDLAGQLGQGGPRIKLSNVNGTINVRHAGDGRSLSPATNQLTNTDNDGDGPSAGEIQRQVEREVEQTQRQVEREVAQAQREAERAGEEARRAAEEARREVEQAQREVEQSKREAEQSKREAERAAERDRVEAQRDSQQARDEAQREAQQARAEAQREAQQAQREAQQAQREAERERAEALREAEQERASALREQEQARREVEQAQREAERERRDAEREAEQARREAERASAEVRGQSFNTNDYNNSYQMVERETKTFAVAGTPRVRVETFDGGISVEAWDKAEVQFTAIKRARDAQAMRAVHLRAEQSGSVVNIIAEADKAQGRAWHDANATVALEVRVPHNTNLDIHTGDGRVRLAGVNGEVTLRTGDGAVDVSDGRGRLHIETGDGRVNVAGFNGEADALSGDGRIMLEGRFTRLTARTSDGGISLTMPADVDATIETNAGLVVNDGLAVPADGSNDTQQVRRWRVGRGGGLISLRTSAGSIYLRRPDSTAVMR